MLDIDMGYNDLREKGAIQFAKYLLLNKGLRVVSIVFNIDFGDIYLRDEVNKEGSSKLEEMRKVNTMVEILYSDRVFDNDETWYDIW